MSNGKLRLWTNGVEIIIATSAEQALTMCARLHGYQDLKAYRRETLETPDNWELKTAPDGAPVEDDDELTLIDEDERTKETRTVGEWIEANGPGLLCGGW